MQESLTAPITGNRPLADARSKFLSHDSHPDPRVRRMILASWQRSRASEVSIDQIRVPYVRDPDLEAPLCRSAAPILDTLGDQLQSESVSIILTDHAGIVLDRRCSSADIGTRLDQVRLAPGFSYAEEFAGTNGIGTSLSSGRAAFVNGAEHYSEELRQFACAGSPIRHPTRGKVIGLLDLTSWSHAPGAMLMALASATARQIEQELLAQTGMRELALFTEYLRVCQQSNGPVLALNNDVVMTNNDLRGLLDGPEHEALVGYAIDTMQSSRREDMRTVQLPSGRSAHLRFIPATSAEGPAGGVFRVRISGGPDTEATVAQLPGRSSTRTPAPLNLPGLVGSGTVWNRCVQQVDSRYRAGDWMALEGEHGTGKRSLLRAVHRLHHPSGHFRVLQAPQPAEFDEWLAVLSEDLTMPEAMIVLVEAERLTEEQAAAVGAVLVEAAADAERHARVAITVNSTAPSVLRSVFPRTVDVPPLRHHIDDLAQLVPHLLGQIPNGARLTCSTAALAQLSRLNWPGNVAQLRGVLLYVVQHRRSGSIELVDLPPECRSTSRRVLTPIEAMERDAIVNALRDRSESPTEAAKNLGISRATIYRKIRQYDISLVRNH